MIKKYFSIFLFIVLLSIPVFSSTINFDPTNTYYYKEEVNLGLSDLSQDVFYVNLKITSQNRTLFESDFLAEDAFSIPFRFEEFYPSSLTVTYSLYTTSQELLDTLEYSLSLTTFDQEIDFFFCQEKFCSNELFDVFPKETDFYLSSSLKESSFNLNIFSEDYNKEHKEVYFPFKLNLKEGMYTLEVSTKINNSTFSQKMNIIVVEKEQISHTQSPSPGITALEVSDEKESFFSSLDASLVKSYLKKYWYVLLIILLLLLLIFKKKNKREPTTKSYSEKTPQKLSRREARKLGVFFLFFFFLLLSQAVYSYGLNDKEYEFRYFTDNFNVLKENFPQENEISLYLTNIKQTNSYYFPLILHTNQSFLDSQRLNLSQGLLSYTPISSLFAIDANKAKGNYASFLPQEQYSLYCKPVMDYFSNYPITTKADLINRNKDYLKTVVGFSEGCIDELISKRWLQEKTVLAEIEYSPYDYKNQSKIIQEELLFKKDLFSQDLIIPVNIIKTDSAVVYAYPDPLNYNSIKVEMEENGWILSNRVNYPLNLNEMEEVFKFNLTQGSFGSFRYTIDNYNENFVDLTVSYLDQDKELSFSTLNPSNYFSLKEGELDKTFITKLNFGKGSLLLNNFEIYNVVENRKARLSKRKMSDFSRIYSKKEYDLFYDPYFDENSFSLSLDTGNVLTPIIKEDSYLFYNNDNDLFKTIDLYLVSNFNNNYYFSEQVANYNFTSAGFLLENDTLKITEIYSSKEYTSFQILFKEDLKPIIISSDRKNIVSTQDPNFYVYKDYYIMTLGGQLRVYKNKTKYSNQKINTYSDYDNKLLYLTGREAKVDGEDSFVSAENLKLFNSYIYDISTAQGFSLPEQKLFWADSFKQIDLNLESWFLENSFCDVDFSSQDFNFLSDNLERMNFTILKYPEHDDHPFSIVLSDTKEYIIPRNTFTQKAYSLLCNHQESGVFKNYPLLILNSAYFLDDQNKFIEQLSFFSTPISTLYPDRVDYPSKYLEEYFTSSKEGVIFLDENGFIKAASSLNLRNDYASAIDLFSNYLVFDRLSIFNPENLVFSFDDLENKNTQRYIKNKFIAPKEKLTLKFKLPKRKKILTDDYIYKKYIFRKSNVYAGNCTKLSVDVARNYNYNNVRDFTEDNDWWGSDFRREDAWFLAKENQVVWNYKKNGPLNPDRLFEGLILGIYIGSNTYTYKDGERAGKTYNVSYTHTAPFIDKYNDQEGQLLNAGYFVSQENSFEYYNLAGRKLIDVIVPKNYYDDKIKDRFGKTELDYVKEYLTSFD